MMLTILKPPILINRFMINLRSTTLLQQSTSHSDEQGANTSLAFASLTVHDSVLGNVGQPSGDDMEREDDDEEPPLGADDHGVCARMDVDGEGNLTSGV